MNRATEADNLSSSQHEQQNQEGLDPELLREIVEASGDGIYSRTLDGIITSWSPGAECISGYSAEEIVGKSITIFTTTESVLTATESVLRGESLLMGDVECVRKDGRHVILSTGIAPLKDRQGTIVGICGVMRDVTDRKKAEDRLRLQAQLLDAVGQAVIATDPDGRIMYWNSAAAELYGYQADEVMGRDATFLLPDDVSRSLGQTVRSQLLTHGSWFGEYEVRRRDGTVVPVFTTISTIGDTDGEALSVIGVSTNITERKQAEEAARSAEQRYRALFLASPIGIELVNAEGVLTETNPAFQEMLGYSAQELVGRHWSDITHPEDLISEDMLDREMDAGTRSRYQLEKRFIRKDGEIIWGRLSSSDVGRIAAADFQFTIGMVEDVTEQKRAQDALRESEERYRSLVDLLPEGVWLVKDGRTVVFANQAAARLHGARRSEDLIGLDVMTLIGSNTLEMATAVTEKQMRGELPEGQFTEYELRRLDGTTFHAEVVTVPLATPTGDVLLLSVERDVTEQRAHEAQLQHLALHDPLTAVANRTLLMDRLDHA
ncbi:MAG TPA: PAS domain S-box protein, partial [Chloroflexota bacterium]